MKFYIGLHHPFDAQHFDRAFISINAVRGRKSPVPGREWILDSGAFTELARFGCYRETPAQYAHEINYLAARNPGLLAVVSQDFMCEPFMLAKTGLTLRDHQRLTIERFDAIAPRVEDVYLMPVLQGYAPETYVEHIEQYGARLWPGCYVGVGSVCKRNADASQILAVLTAIKSARPDLLLHGFGLKLTALASAEVRARLYSADSMAWSWAARRQGRGRDANSWLEAKKFEAKVAALQTERVLPVLRSPIAERDAVLQAQMHELVQ